jgi:hypothetical protein
MEINCKNWTPLTHFRGNCSEGKYKGNPTFGQCVDRCRECKTDRDQLTKWTLAQGGVSKTPIKITMNELVERAALVSARARVCRTCKEECLVQTKPCMRKNLNTKCPFNKWSK